MSEKPTGTLRGVHEEHSILPLTDQYIDDLSEADMENIYASIGEDRLSTFFRHTQTRREALDLYALNAGISKHVFELIGGFEIALRNAVSASIAEHHQRNDWYRARCFTQVLTGDRRANIREVRKRLAIRNRSERTGRIVAGLTFHFWVAMHEKKYRDTIWTPHLNKIWPKGENLKRVHKDLLKIRDLRNRIAHFEPVFDTIWLNRVDDIWARFDQVAPDKSAWYRHRMGDRIATSRQELSLISE